jgi:hypothetical protein
VTKSLPGFDYFGHGDTSLLIVLRNALHHRDHSLFVSLNAHIGLGEGPERLLGAAYLLGSTTPEDETQTNQFYFPLHDFYSRLPNAKLKNPDAIKLLWDSELGFQSLAAAGANEGYPSEQVYIDVMPAFMTAVSRVSLWLEAIGFQPLGHDGKVYYEHFKELTRPSALAYKRLRIA